jgi:putative two-component system response regulator
MSINEHTLYKPGRLTDSEFGLVKQHTVIGGHLLEPLGLDSRIQEVVMFHHENFDGSGYPYNLKGEDIPFLARIMRITDSYDALMADRPYHMGVSSKQALDILSKDSHFYDPYLLKTFRVMAEMGGI